MIWLIILHKIPPNLGGWGEPVITLGLKNFSLTDVESQSRIEVQNSVFQGKDLKQLSELQFFLESSFGWCQVSKTPCKNIMEILFHVESGPPARSSTPTLSLFRNTHAYTYSICTKELIF